MKQNIPSPPNVFFRRVDVSFPPYRYVPGLHPHPIKHPQGHMYNGGYEFVKGEDWYDDEQFLYGADLFDGRFYWESHENWEHCWHQAKGSYKICIQGLIQVSAAILKHHMGSVKSRNTLLKSASQKLQCGEDVNWCFDGLIHDTREFFVGGDWPVLGREFPKK
ncbi:MAG: hypothetical protein CL916_01155 [Deltaproteobacteria bacterium]|nr:hypothetical protein [Deltaproteobacteria bacterium]